MPQYVSAVTICSYYGNESGAKFDLQTQGYTVINQNLTPDVYRTYTYLGSLRSGVAAHRK